MPPSLRISSFVVSALRIDDNTRQRVCPTLYVGGVPRQRIGPTLRVGGVPQQRVYRILRDDDPLPRSADPIGPACLGRHSASDLPFA